MTKQELDYRTAAYIKHRLGSKLLSINCAVRNIKRGLDDNYDDWGQIKVSKRFNLTLDDSFRDIYETLHKVNEILSEHDNQKT